LAAPSTALSNPPAEAQLTVAEEQYGQQQYRRTVDVLRDLLYPSPKLKSPDDIHRARELLGAAYWFLDEKTTAEREWQFLLLARPGLVLDKFVYPKPMRDFFEALRDTLIAQGVIRRASAIEEPKVAPTVLRVTQYVENRSRATTWMPFGVPQFDDGADGWGYWFATSQAASGLTSVGTMLAAYIVDSQARGRTDGPTADDKQLQSTLALTAVISGAVFYGLYTWGVIDANTRYKPQRIVRTETTYDNTETADIRPPQPGRTSQPPAVPRAGGSR